MKFRIKPKSTLAVGDTILNLAAIYFDFNRPVHTNIELTSVILPVMVDMVDPSRNLMLYPNPVGSELNVVLHSSMKKIQLRIVNMIGEIIYSSVTSNSDNGVMKIDVKTLAEGVYILETDDGKVITHKKFVKQGW